MTLSSSVTTQLKPPSNPRLPAAPVEYDARYVDSLNSILRQYFNQIDNLTQSLLTNTGGRFMRTVCGSFYDTTTQTPTTINTPKLVNISTTDATCTNAITMASSRITVTYPGIYNVQFSVQSTNTDTQAHDAAIWIRKNGTDLASSDSVWSIQGTHGGQPGYNVTAANFFVPLNASDYIEFWWSSNSLQVQLNSLPAITSPFTAPAAPGVIVTMTFVSAPLT